MRKLITRISLFTAVFLCSWSGLSYAQQAKITGLKSAKGKIILTLFQSAKAFEEEKPDKKLVLEKKQVVNGTMLSDLMLPAGTYGMVLVDDENGNGKMEKNFIGIPKEGIAFSDFYMGGLKKPAYKDFTVDVRPGKQIVFRMRYF